MVRTSTMKDSSKYKQILAIREGKTRKYQRDISKTEVQIYNDQIW